MSPMGGVTQRRGGGRLETRERTSGARRGVVVVAVSLPVRHRFAQRRATNEGRNKCL